MVEETIDLTAPGDSDIDRAVAESLRDAQGGGIFGGQVTQEEEQISKFVSFFMFCATVAHFHFISQVIGSAVVFLSFACMSVTSSSDCTLPSDIVNGHVLTGISKQVSTLKAC